MRSMKLRLMGGLCLVLGTILVAGCGSAPQTGEAQQPATVTTPSAEPVAVTTPSTAPVAVATVVKEPRSRRRSSESGPVRHKARLYTLEAGTAVPVQLQEDLSSGLVTAGQSVAAVVSEAVKVNGRTLVPSGARVQGRVAEVKPAKRFGGQASLVVQFERVLLPGGGAIDVQGQMIAQGPKETGRDAAKIGGGAAAGAFLGKVLGHKSKTTRRGALLGAAVGTAAASKKGAEAFIEAGSEVLVTTRTRASVSDG